MTAFDYALLFVLVCSVIIGTMRGFLKEVLSLVSWAVAFIVANMYGGQLAPMLPSSLPGETVRLIIAFVVIFLAVRIAMALLAKTVDALISVGGLSGLNRMLGSLFGLARGLLIAIIAVFLCGMTTIPQQPFWQNAMFSPMAERAVMKVLPYLPDKMAKNVRY